MRKNKRIVKSIMCAVLSAGLLFPTCLETAYAVTVNNISVTEKDTLAFEVNTDGVEESDRKFKSTITFESYNDSENGFNGLTETVMIGETAFILNDLENLKMIDSRTPKRRTMNVTTEPFIKGEENFNLPADTMKEEDATWTLTEKKLVDSEIEDIVKDAVTSKRYVGVEVGVPIPDAIDYVYTDENTGLSVETELPLTDKTESEWYWTEFHFPITISGYDADVLDLNGLEIRSDEPLINYKAEFLDMLGLDQELYTIDTIEWAGEPYEDDDLLCRDAYASGTKYVTDVDAVYAAEVHLPLEGAAWECTYIEELEKGKSAIYKYTADAVYVSSAEDTPLGKLLGLISAVYEAIIEAIKEHPIIAATQLILIAALITLFLAKRKKKCIYEKDRICEYARDCSKCPFYASLNEVKEE